jgi:hypothetical protein
MKSSGSPCPLDQLSIICIKRCPYLRTYLSELIHEVWLSGTLPNEWGKACTILIHKKGNTDDPSNFRPITLESIPLKVFTSCLRNAIYSFLASNNFIEHGIQKGFIPNLSGTLEHTAQMADIINKARIRQRAVVISPYLIWRMLSAKSIIISSNQYSTDHPISTRPHPRTHKIRYKKFIHWVPNLNNYLRIPHPFIYVGRGVLQGDCLSPLLFNMCFNTFIQHIKAEKYRQCGFSFKLLNPICTGSSSPMTQL